MERDRFVFATNIDRYKQITEYSGDAIGDPIMPCDMETIGNMPYDFSPFNFLISCSAFKEEYSRSCAEVGIYSLFTVLTHLVQMYHACSSEEEEEQPDMFPPQIQFAMKKLLFVLESACPDGFFLDDIGVESIRVRRFKVPHSTLAGVIFYLDVVYSDGTSRVVKRLIPSGQNDALVFLIEQFLPCGFRIHRLHYPCFNHRRFVEPEDVVYPEDHPLSAGCYSSSEFDSLIEWLSNDLQSFIEYVARMYHYTQQIEHDLSQCYIDEPRLCVFFSHINVFKIYKFDTYVLFALCVCLKRNTNYPLPEGSLPTLSILRSVYPPLGMLEIDDDSESIAGLEDLIRTLLDVFANEDFPHLFSSLE